MHVDTVLGEVAVADIQRVLPHEHLLSLVPGPWLIGGPLSQDQRAGIESHLVDLAVQQLMAVRQNGFNFVLDLSPYGVVGRDETGANSALLAEISHRSGVHIGLGTSIYLEAFAPEWLRTLSREEIARLFVRDLHDGMAQTSVRACVIGEQATGLDEISNFARRCLLAACDAHKETGAPIFTHTTHGSMALEQIEIFCGERVDLKNVVIGHMDIQHDRLYTKQVLDSGVSVALDTIGKQYWEFFLGPKKTPLKEGEFPGRFYFRSDESRLNLLDYLVAEGHLEQILLAQDLTGAEAYLNPLTHGTWGLNYLDQVFLPALRDRGFSESQINVLTRENPLRMVAQP